MKVTIKTDYACRALLELSFHWPNIKPLQLSEIAKRQKIPIKFLIHILIQLKNLGYIDSVRGKMGGYVLAKAPPEINFGKLMQDLGDFSILPHSIKNKDKHVMDGIWEEIDQGLKKIMNEINFESICNRKRSKDKSIMYEI